MSRLPLVKIRFCGGCNPEIDRGKTAQQVITLLKGRMNTTFDPDIAADLTLHVCGCAHACLDEENPVDDAEHVVSIQGLRVDREPVPEGKLADATINKLLQEDDFARQHITLEDGIKNKTTKTEIRNNELCAGSKVFYTDRHGL